jgi:molecular chaperone DnaK (HSP70)
MQKYVIGIDLGTTNCCLSWSKEAGEMEDPSISPFAFKQYSSSGDLKESFSLPSFIFFPPDQEEKIYPETDGLDCIIGELAQVKSQELPSKVVSSAKSWLGQKGLKEEGKILPLLEEEKEKKISPLDSIALLLGSIKLKWEAAFPESPFKEQNILITVPASFDPKARSLVQKAAEKAAYPEFKFLEEPQAAFYAYLHKHKKLWREKIEAEDRILVLDIGGGTCDFSLIQAVDQDGSLQLERLAVGDHLLLGGDNMDLALAYRIKMKLEEKGTEIDEWQFNKLINQSRRAKEYLLSSRGEQNVFKAAIEGRGSSFIASSVAFEVTREEVYEMILEGFFPVVSAQDQAQPERTAALSDFGLPFAKDPRISAQLAKFLSRTGESNEKSLEQFILPNKVLFNGGVLKSSGVQDRFKEIFAHWSKELNQKEVEVLESSHEDLNQAVSIGACYYALAVEGKGIKIKADLACSYFIGVESNMPAIPGMPAPIQALCVAPYGMEEGGRLFVENQSFNLLVGEEASFRFFSRSTPLLKSGLLAKAGSKVSRWKDELKELSPLKVTLKSKEAQGYVQVRLQAVHTELGSLELWFESAEEERWKIEFNLRNLNQNSMV